MLPFYILCPSSPEDYQDMLENLGPRLDDAGVSFHICRPGEDITDSILSCKEVTL